MKKRRIFISTIIVFIVLLLIIAKVSMKNEITIEKNIVNLKNLDADTTTVTPYDDNGIKYVTYEQFGAIAGDEEEDFDAIRAAHVFANAAENNVDEVRSAAETGKAYQIFAYNEKNNKKTAKDVVTIKTNVDWKNATFIIHDEEVDKFEYPLDEEGNITGNNNIFEIKHLGTQRKIQNTNFTITTATKQITDEAVTSQLSGKTSDRYLIEVINRDKKQFKRVQSEENISEGSYQVDCFKIDGQGNVLNDIQWNFDKITEINIWKIPETTIEIKNGKFITNAISSEISPYEQHKNSSLPEYFFRGIRLDRAGNVKISNITHGLSEDKVSGSYRGFVYAYRVVDIELTNCNFFPRKAKKTSEEKTKSTYDLYFNRGVNITCANLKQKVSDSYKALYDEERWGIMGSYHTKDVVFDHCILNRIDSHEGIYKLTVKNCTLGCFGLCLVGPCDEGANNTLNVVKTTITAPYFIRLRADYGSTYNGTANIIDCTFKYGGTEDSPAVFMESSFENVVDTNGHDFGYKNKLPNLNIQNLTVDLNSKRDDFYIFVVWRNKK